jgi:hypothetical protein
MLFEMSYEIILRDFYGYYTHEIWGLGIYVKLVTWDDHKNSLNGVSVYMLVTHR